MSAFLADVTTKSFNKNDYSDLIHNLDKHKSDYVDDNLDVINKNNDFKKNKSDLKLSKIEKTKSITLHNETSDSGLNLSD